MFLGFLIEPESVNIQAEGENIHQNVWEFNSSTGMLFIGLPDSLARQYERVTVYYRSPVINIEPTIRLREFEQVTDTATADTADQESITRAVSSSEELFGTSDLQQSGSLTRGFTVGNRQDLALDSGLRIDLSGNITDDIEILASLTDQSTPIQPDGATQNIREFDRVYIQLQAPVGELELGDVDLTLDQSRFARINRRVQGAAGIANTRYGDFGGGASVSKGQFRTQRFSGIEGVQGPYRLSGAENETFIIVIAGSETVYVDGTPVNRGAENEYIIDYGLGEITFTNNLVITDDTRIVVEFQYITQQFTRTLFTARGQEDNLLDGRLSVGATYIREADNKNPNTQLNLSESEIERLRNLGNNVDDLYVSGADSIGFQENSDFVLYARIDTMANGEEYEIFKNIPGDPRSVYRVQFTNFGEGNGSYRRVGGAVNGILYEWVGPDQGRYEPVVRLQAPQSHQMFALESSYSINNYLSLQGEWAVSDFDRNRFSEIGNDTNTDHALSGELVLSGVETRLGSFEAVLEQKYIGKRFEFFDRPREIEFDRRWNIQRAVDEDEEEIETNLTALLQGENDSWLEVSAGRLTRDLFEGRRIDATVQMQDTNWPALWINTDFVESTDNRLDQEGAWFRQQGEISYPISSVETVEISPFLNWEMEKRDQRSTADSLLPSSLQFYDWNPGLRFDFGSLTVDGGLGYRINKRPLDNSLRNESISRSQRFRLQYQPSGRFNTTNSLQLRQKDVEPAFRDEVASPRTRGILLKSTTNYSVFDDNIDGELLYEANTERRALMQETYIEVGPELGQFEWIDLNSDGAQQLDEFFPEVTQNEGSYIRQFVPSDDLIPVIDVMLRSRNEFQLGKIVSRLTAINEEPLEFLTWNSLIEIQETSREEDLRKVYFLNPSVLRDAETTINGRQLVRQQLRWRNQDRSIETSLSYTQSEMQLQRAAGNQNRLNRNLSMESEYQLSDIVRLLGSVQHIKNMNENTRFNSRNYDISGYEISPGFRIFLGRSAQTELRTLYSKKENTSASGAAGATTFSVENQTQLFLFGRLQNRLRLQIRHTDIDGVTTGQAQFELTDGHGTGTNLVWSLNSNYRATSLIRLSLQYNGRTTTENQIIQTLRLVVGAVF